MRVVLSDIRKEIQSALNDMEKPIAAAATGAVTEAANTAKTEGRANIAAAGFSKKWQNGLRADVFPKGGRQSMRPAALVRHKIPYAGVFEEGAAISGKPLLWLPLNSKIGSRGNKLTPSKYAKEVGPLVSVNRPGKPPLLFPKRRKGQQGEIRPVFIGIKTVNIGKKFNIIGIVKRAASQLGQLYLKHLRT